MRQLLTRIGGLLRNAALPAEAGPLPLAAGAMLSHEWLAPHLVHLPSRISHPRGRDEACSRAGASPRTARVPRSPDS